MAKTAPLLSNQDHGQLAIYISELIDFNNQNRSFNPLQPNNLWQAPDFLHFLDSLEAVLREYQTSNEASQTLRLKFDGTFAHSAANENKGTIRKFINALIYR